MPIKNYIASQAVAAPNDWLVLAFSAVGLNLAVGDYIGGVVMAMAAASFMRRHSKDGRSMILVLLTAAFLATVAAIAHPFFEEHVFAIKVQFLMISTGFFSKLIANVFGAASDRMEHRAADITDTIIDKVVDDER